MTITFITKEEHKFLLDTMRSHPRLCLQNVGYETIDQSKFDDDDKKAFDKVTELLKNHIVGFSCFNNFKLSKDNKERV